MPFSDRIFSKEVCSADACPSSLCTGSPTSRRKRIRRTEGSSESDGVPCLGDEIIFNQDYRCGGPMLVDLPAISRPFSHRNPAQIRWVSELGNPVREILARHSVDYRAAAPVLRSSEAALTKEWYHTILVSAKRHYLNDSWYQACKEILSFLEIKGVNCSIEIIDDRADEYPMAYAIRPNHPFVNQWPSVKGAILNALGSSDWTLLGAFSSGKHDITAPRTITVLIMVRVESTLKWTDIREEIIKVLDDRDLGYVAVRIQRGSILQASFEQRLLGKEDWVLPTVFGGSIGPRDSATSLGTFGGYLELQSNDGTWHRYGITNYHCIRDGFVNPEGWDKFGLRPADARNNPVFVDQPSLKYHEASIGAYENNIKEHASETDEEIKQRIRSEDSSVPKALLHRYLIYEDLIKMDQALIDQGNLFVQNNNHHLGKVFAASGYRTTDSRHILDWALVEVESRRMGLNEIPRHSDPYLKDALKSIYSSDKKYLSGTAEFLHGMQVFKKGNRTGLTGGVLDDHFKASVQHWIPNNDGSFTSVNGEAYMVLPKASSCFGDAGDSGSLVIGYDGSLAGLFLGGDPQYGWGIIIDWKDIFADIKLMTGAKSVRVPSS